MLTGYELLQSSELSPAALEYARALEFAPGSRPREFLRLLMYFQLPLVAVDLLLDFLELTPVPFCLPLVLAFLL